MSTRASIASSPVASLPLIVSAVLVLLFGGAAAAVAAPHECDGVSFPERIQAGGETLTLNGLGLRKATIFNIKVYVGALYVAHPSSDPEAVLSSPEPAEIELRFVFHVTAGQLRDAWREGFGKSAPGQLAQLKSRIDQLDGWMTSVGSGQRMTFLRIPGVGIQYSLDGVPKGTLAGDDFARAFLAIWLGPSPPSEALRAGLLGGACT
jgi:hypothetical protein